MVPGKYSGKKLKMICPRTSDQKLIKIHTNSNMNSMRLFKLIFAIILCTLIIYLQVDIHQIIPLVSIKNNDTPMCPHLKNNMCFCCQPIWSNLFNMKIQLNRLLVRMEVYRQIISIIFYNWKMILNLKMKMK